MKVCQDRPEMVDALLCLQLGLGLQFLFERADVLKPGWKEKRLCSTSVRSWARLENIIRTVNKVGAIVVAPG